MATQLCKWLREGVFLVCALIVVLAPMDSVFAAKASSEKVSQPGQYAGYSERRYDGYERSSRYVPVRDGTRLAVDVYIPTRKGIKESRKFPTLFYSTHYVRAKVQEDGSLTTMFRIEDKDSTARFLLEHGYAIVAADVRGSGASFGTRPGEDRFYQVTGQDSYDLIEWMARQPWSNGNVGMFGGSFMGHQQIAAAGANPPSLKAIIPHGHIFWGVNFPGGSPIQSSMQYLSAVSRLDGREDGTLSEASKKWLSNPIVAGKTAPVDGRTGSAELAAVIKDRTASKDSSFFISLESLLDMFSNSAFHSAIHDVSARAIESKIPMYNLIGLYDLSPEGPLLYAANAKGPVKANVGPWTHGPNEPNDPKTDAHKQYLKSEALRWHDYWLKGIENGIMDEPSIHYAVIGQDSNRWGWLATDQWPAKNVKRKDFHFGVDAKTGSLLNRAEKTSETLQFTVDYTATTGVHTRYWDPNGYGPLHYPEMSENNTKGLTFTSEPLPKALALAGAPVVSLNLTSTSGNPQIHVYLEKVTADGRSHFVTDGVMLASWRKLIDPPFESFGWPHADGSVAALQSTPPLNAGVDTMKFRLVPAGMVFEKGSRIRVLITGADADNFYQEELAPAPDITIHTGKVQGSKISLPLVKSLDRLNIQEFVKFDADQW